MIQFAVAVILFLTVSGIAPSPAETGPGVRNAHGMASDGKCVIVFGGADASAVRDDTWCWRNGAWTRLATSGPAARTFPAMAGDPKNHRVFLFGGNRVLFGADLDPRNILDDFWLWDGSRWKEITGPRPPARAEAGMAYDVRRKRLVLFGGYRVEGEKRERLGDTWEWDGREWRQVGAGGPSARNGMAMAYDGSRRSVVLFGGSGGPNNETWEWNGNAWRRIDTASVPGRFNAAIAFDPQGGELVRFGGWDGEKRVAETWVFKGSEWRQLSGAAPAARNHTAMAFDESSEALILFGGHDGPNVFGDVWEYRSGKWSQRVSIQPQPRVDNGH